MMRWVLLATLVVALSAAVTVLVQFLPENHPETVTPPRVETAGPTPTAVVDGSLTFNFGSMPQLTTSSHTWAVRNEGKGDLTLFVKGTTCKCTVANLGAGGKAAIKPGGQTEIRLEWSTKEVNGIFRQSATIATNDPEHPELAFEVSGTVQPPILIYPPELAVQLASTPNDQGAQADKAIYSPDRPELKITAIKSSRPDLIEGTIKPLDEDRLKTLKAKAGHLLEIHVKPSTALGPFHEELVISTDHPSQREVRLYVSGKLVGPINTSPDEVRSTNISGERGGIAPPISLWVRGQEETRFDVQSVPSPLKVAIAPADGQAKVGGAVRGRQYRLTVTVPPGTAPGEIQGMIELKTTHPQAGQLAIPVRIIVVGAG